MKKKKVVIISNVPLIGAENQKKESSHNFKCATQKAAVI